MECDERLRKCSYWTESNDCLYLVGDMKLMALRRICTPGHDFIDCMHIDFTQSIIPRNFQSSVRSQLLSF